MKLDSALKKLTARKPLESYTSARVRAVYRRDFVTGKVNDILMATTTAYEGEPDVVAEGNTLCFNIQKIGDKWSLVDDKQTRELDLVIRIRGVRPPPQAPVVVTHKQGSAVGRLFDGVVPSYTMDSYFR